MNKNTQRIAVKLSLVIVGFALLLCSNALRAQEETTAPQIDVVKIDNYIINPVTTKFIAEAIDEAANNNAPCLIIELDTPGGLLESTRILVKTILNSKVPIVTYISPSGSRAGSAGVFITYASHIAAMAPSTNIGAAHPIGIGFTPSMEKKEKGKDAQDVLADKVMNDLLAWVEGIAKTNNRNVKWVKQAITESVSATEKEAVRKNIIDLVAVDLDELLEKIDAKEVTTKYGKKIIHTKNATIRSVELSNRERILNTIAHPNIAYILMMLGVIGLVFEFSHPGIGFPGIAGLICTLLAFYSFQLLPINYTGLLLIILAIVLLIAEALTPTFGLLTLGGIVSFIFGSLMLIKSPYPFLKISLSVIIPAIALLVVTIIFVLAATIKTHRRKVSTGQKGLIDTTATALSKFTKKGKVFCHGEIWTAYNTKKDTIRKDDEVRIVRVEGLKLFVKKIPRPTGSS